MVIDDETSTDGLTMLMAVEEKPEKPEKSEKKEKSSEDNTERLIELLFGEYNGESHALFCELEELIDGTWYESARWVRFEEDVEVGGGRWSKPFVAALSLHSLFELRHHLSSGSVLLDVSVKSFRQLTNTVADLWVDSKLLEPRLREAVVETLNLRHVHQFEQAIGLKRGLTEIGKKLSAWRLVDENGHSLPSEMSGIEKEKQQEAYKQNENFARKLAPGSEASTSMVGGVDYLRSTISAFVRLSSRVTLHECSEVSLPVRFIFFLLGPSSRSKDLREVGRSMETVMSDDIFRDVAYHSTNRSDLLTGLDEFLDEGTALPPSEWDPTIRIEPPKKVPSSETRKMHVLNQMDKSLSTLDLPARVAAISRALSEATVRHDPARRTSSTPAEPSKVRSWVSSKVNIQTSLNAFMNELLKKQTDDEEEQPHIDHPVDPSLQRTGKLFGGLRADIKRKRPWYRSDFTDALNVQCVASVFYLFFACLSPIVTFGGLLGDATKNNMAAFESILTGAVCGTTYHLFSGQPVTILGSTGPVLVFEKILFSFSDKFSINYLTFRFWIGLWASLFLMTIVAFDMSCLVQLITRFTEECFATLISVIFIFESFKALYGVYERNGISTTAALTRNYTCWCDWVQSNFSHAYSLEKVIANGYDADEFDCRFLNASQCTVLDPPCERYGPGCDFSPPVPDVFFFSCLIYLGTCSLSFGLKNFRTSSFFPSKVRCFISDFAVFISIIAMVVVDFLVGLPTPKLRVPTEFAPTRPDRDWVVSPFVNPIWTIAAAPLPAMLLAVLLFMDQQITAVIVNRKEHKLRKGKGYHLDLFVLSIDVAFCASFGLPYFVAATVLAITHVNSLRKQSATSAPGEQPKFLGLLEQRVTGLLVFVLIGCSIPLRGILKYIPMPVLYGVFLYMGLAALQTSQFYSRVLLFFMPVKYQPDAPYLRHMKTWRVHLFTAVQLAAFVVLCIVKQIKIISILFILMLVVMVILRKLLDHVFTQNELRWLDEVLPKNPLAVQKGAGDQANEKPSIVQSPLPANAVDVKKYKKKRPSNKVWRRLRPGSTRQPPDEQQQMQSLAAPPTIVVVSPSRDNSGIDLNYSEKSERL